MTVHVITDVVLQRLNGAGSKHVLDLSQQNVSLTARGVARIALGRRDARIVVDRRIER
jgi:hypothetical protein